MLEIKNWKSSQTFFNSFQIMDNRIFISASGDTDEEEDDEMVQETEAKGNNNTAWSWFFMQCKISYHTCLNGPENVYAKHILVLLLVFMDLPVRN